MTEYVNRTFDKISISAGVMSTNLETHSRLTDFRLKEPELFKAYMDSIGTVLQELARDIDANTTPKG